MKKLPFISFLLLLISKFCIAQIPTNGLTGYWPFSGYQLANDYSGNSNNGTVHGATLTTDRFGNCEQAYKFNGINSYIEVLNSPTVDMNNTDFTVAFWIKTYATDSNGLPISKNVYGSFSGYDFKTNNNDPGYCTNYKHGFFYVAAGAGQDVCTDNDIFIDTTWHLITGLYKSTTNQAYLYVDAVLQSGVGQAVASSSNNQNLVFGAHNNTSINFFTGVIDAVRIYQRALSAAEITQLYNEPNPGPGCTISTCTALGVPTYSNNFGSGAALYGPTLPTGETNYPFITGNPPNGSYVISSSSDPSGATGSAGDYIVAPDHTGNPNGYMMVINSDYTTGNVLTTSITGLSPNTTYVFSAYLANNDDPTAPTVVCGGSYIYANVKLQVEYPAGTVQGSVSTGNMPVSLSHTVLPWAKYGFTFTTVAGQTSADLVMINNAPGGCGNDYVVDDISVSPCCTGGNLISITGNTVVCSGATTTLTATGASTYTWSANAGNALNASVAVTPSVTTTYTVTANAGTCGSQMTVVTVSVVPNLPVSITGDTTICIGQTTTLTASGANNYIWSANAGSATTTSVVLSPTVTTIYSVVGEAGTCIGQAIATVSVVTQPLISISGNMVICTGQSTTLTASGANNYIWNTGANTSSIVLTPAVTTNYAVVGEIGTCLSQTVATIDVIKNIRISISGDTTICYGQSSLLTASGANTYNWNTGETTATITISPTSTTNYIVVGAISTCTAQAMATVSVNTVSDFSMPNIVTPNNDEVNDFIDFGKYQFSSIRLNIYNRWGLKIFESTNPACIWKPIEDDGTYFYIIQYSVDCNNEPQSKILKGFITVVR